MPLKRLISWITGGNSSGGSITESSPEDDRPTLSPEELGRLIKKTLSKPEARLFELQSRRVPQSTICQQLNLSEAQIRLLRINVHKKLQGIWKRYDVNVSLRRQLSDIVSDPSPAERETHEIKTKD